MIGFCGVGREVRSDHPRCLVQFSPAILMVKSFLISSPVCSTILTSKDVPSHDLFDATYEKIYSVVQDEHWWIGSLHFDVTAGIFAS
jgi:hypothetical protein